jgi:tetratricopeptide (TPR) repeat protein
MALANAAWILASNDRRVLMVDWDLEAPGLHKYFHPFLEDKDLKSSPGVINLVHEYRSAVLNHPDAASGAAELPPDWYEEQADVLRYATEIAYPFDGSGALHFMPAGTQDVTYATLVNRFSWEQLFDSLGGFYFFEAVKRQMKREYDYVLIDSRTGVSDTSGLCTVHLPDQMVVCFTLNNQSIEGASGVAADACGQRGSLRSTQPGEGAGRVTPGDVMPPLRIWPLPTRIEGAEKDKADRALERARALFDPLMDHLPLAERRAYWGAAGIRYEPYYAYEEILATFRDLPGQTQSMLASMERFVAFLTNNEVTSLRPIPEKRRRDTLLAFSRRPPHEILRALGALGPQYEEIRRLRKAGGERTAQMAEIVYRAQTLVDKSETPAVALELFNQGSDGARVVAFAVALASPTVAHFDMAIDGIARRRSPFEQYHALALGRSLLERLGPAQRRGLLEAVRAQLGTTVTQSDGDRWALSQEILEKLNAEPASGAPPAGDEWTRFAPAPPRLAEGSQWHLWVWAPPDRMLWARNLRDLLAEQGWQVFLNVPAGGSPQTGLVPASQAALARSLDVAIVTSPRVSIDSARKAIEQTRPAQSRVMAIQLDSSDHPGDYDTRFDWTAHPDGLTAGPLLELLYWLARRPLADDAEKFAAALDQAAREAGAVISAAVRNGLPDRILEQFHRDGIVWRTSPTLGCKAGDALIKLNRNADAIEVLTAVGAQFPKALRPKQLRALALARGGALEDLMAAQDLLGTLYELGERDPETLGIYARTWKSRYYISGDRSDLREARDLYAEAQALSPADYYTAINAASTSALLDTPTDAAHAVAFADKALALLGYAAPARDFWAAATIAEAWLIKRDFQSAAKNYEVALRAARLEIGSHQSVWRQACSLLDMLQPTPGQRDLIRRVFAHLPDCPVAVGREDAETSGGRAG